MKIIKEDSNFEVFMNKGQAGAGRVVAFPQTQAKEIIHVPLSKNTHEVWTVCGNSLVTDDPKTTIYDGERVIIRTGITAADAVGRLCVLRLYGCEDVIKQVARLENGRVHLESNEKPVIARVDDVEILGVVEWVLRKWR